MSEFKVILPKLGESIQEATITRWFVREGDTIKEDDKLLEVATDKVDSEIPSPVEGVVEKIFYPEGSLLPVGEIIAIIRSGNEQKGSEVPPEIHQESQEITNRDLPASETEIPTATSVHSTHLSNRFYSPLVKKIAEEEKVSVSELSAITGTGTGGRVQKKDILLFLETRNPLVSGQMNKEQQKDVPVNHLSMVKKPGFPVSIGAEDQIIEMDRVRKLIADHMVMSVKISPHVTTVVEADVTNLVIWRTKVKEEFQSRYGEKLTYMPVFMEAVSRALTEFPLVNSCVDGDRIILRKHINLGIAVAKPDGNLIVPVIRNTEEMNLTGLTKHLNRLANAARTNKLLPEEIQEGTFTITNFGTFRNLIGTPIINQPQVAILATGSIEKKPAVLELPTGDVIAIRHKMFLSLSYDHRIIDGSLGGAFLRRIADLLEEFDYNRSI
jgi:2-oxoglutarate dehydrogenase E2 component (dihydrolipoamide succinyltransferase)